jgi:DNA-binding NarL/FixJ family response regulator
MLNASNYPAIGGRMESSVNGSVEPTTIRLVVVALRQLEADGIAALCQSHAEFRVLSATNNFETAAMLCHHRRPDVVLLDAAFVGGDACRSFSKLLDMFAESPTLVIDDEINESRLTAILEHPRLGYFTRRVSFTEIAHGISCLARGERAFGPLVMERLQATPKGWRIRRDASSSPFAQLTPREIEVLRLIAQGSTIKDCANQLSLSPSTVDNHKTRLMKKLGVHRSLELTRLAVREGLITL